MQADPALQAQVLAWLESPRWSVRLGAAMALLHAPGGPFQDTLQRVLASLDDQRGLESYPARLEAASFLINRDPYSQGAVRACLEALAPRYRLGLVANQPSAVREAMARDGIDRYFEVWGVSDDLGMEKPDPRLFSHVLDEVDVPPSRTAMVGDRLDYDVRPAKAAGMRAVWVLRGEAPDDPTPEQLAEPDACVRSLAELPEVLERL